MKRTALAVCIALAVVAPAQLNPGVAKPPVAKKVLKETPLHGEVLQDNYFWVREKTNPEVIKYLKAENAYTEAVMKPTKALQAKLYKEMLGRIQETDLTVPYRMRGYIYYTRTVKGKQYPIHCRRKGSMKAKEQVLLDLNAMAKGKKYIGLGAFEISDDSNKLAYSVDTTGFRQYTLYVKDLRTGKVLPDRAQKVDSIEWAADNKTLFYSVDDAAKRPHRLYRHRLGSKKDALVFEEPNGLYWFYTYKSSDDQFIFLVSESSEDNVTRYIPSIAPQTGPAVVLPLEKDHQYYVDHRKGRFFIRTNKDAKDFKLVSAPVEDPSDWKTVIPARKGVKLEDVELFKDFMAVWERKNALMQLKITSFSSGKSHYVTFPESVYGAGANTNAEFDTDTYRFSYESFLSPSSVYDYNVNTRKKTLLKQTVVKGGYDKSKYVTKRLFATASDGTKVPITLMHLKSMKLTGNHPTYLTGYGSYGSSEDPYFSTGRLSLVNRGIVFALAHIRGGGDMGEEWHDQGKMMNKKNTFTDFIACAEHLIAQKYTNKNKLVIQGGSAGGLLIGAVINMRPDLFKAAILNVPFVDVINTMLDESLPLTTGEFLEWGNPKIKAEYDYIRTYSPYENIADKPYPDLLVNTSLNDSQVMYWEPAKYVARMRATRTDKKLVMLRTFLEPAGHGGPSGRYDQLKRASFDFAFVLAELGIWK
jgi:oligopeptidase B